MLWISGGCLCPKKCWWHAIDFHWRRDGALQYRTVLDTRGELLIPDHKKVDQHVVQIDPMVGMKGLGVFLVPDRNNIDQFDKLLQKNHKHGQQI